MTNNVNISLLKCIQFTQIVFLWHHIDNLKEKETFDPV